MPQSAKMPSITLSQLRDTKRLLAWLRAGKTVELRERNGVIAHIVPVKEDDGPKAQDSSGGNPNRKLITRPRENSPARGSPSRARQSFA